MVGIGDRIAAYLRRRGLSQVTLAGVAGRSESWLSHVERGQRDVDSLTAIRDLAAELGDAGEAIVQLLDAEQIAPQAIRFHPRSATPSPSSSAAAAPTPGCCTISPSAPASSAEHPGPKIRR